jgi:hypothetical protein
LDSNAGCAVHNFHLFGWQRDSLDQMTSVVNASQIESATADNGTSNFANDCTGNTRGTERMTRAPIG